MSKIKLHILDKDPGTYKEVRKIYVDEFGLYMDMTLAEIRERMKIIFPGLKGKNFDILWKDEESTIITIGSDMELLVAMEEMDKKCSIDWSAKAYNLYIKLSVLDTEAWPRLTIT